MKVYVINIVALFGLSVAYGQQTVRKPSLIPNPAQDPSATKPLPAPKLHLTGEEWRFHLVERLLSLPSPVHNGVVQLRGMGDEAAIDITKILDAKGSLTIAELNAALDIIHMSFERPKSIIEPTHRKPLAALFLLQRFNVMTNDPTVKQRITEAFAFLNAVQS